MQTQQLEMPLDAAHAAGMEAAEACLTKAKRVADFDAEGAGRFIVSWIVRHGATSGEELVKAANDHGFRGHDNRCFGGVFKRLASTSQIRCIRSDLPRSRGHGTSGGKLWELAR